MRRSAILFSSLGIVMVVAAVPLQAQTTKWVDQAGGSDSNDGNTEATAYASLQFAIDNSTNGVPATPSVIHVKDGTYGVTGQSTDATCQDSFAAAIVVRDLDYLTIQAVPGHEPVIKPVTVVESDIISLAIERSSYIVINNIDSDQSVAQFDHWHVCQSHDLTLLDSSFTGGEDGIDFNTDHAAALIENNAFIDINTGSGNEVLDLTDGSYSGIVIQDNLFQNNYRHILIDPPSGSTASGFTIRRNDMDGTTSEEGIRLIGASMVLIENNVIMNNMQQGIYIDSGCSDITVRHNSFFNNDQEDDANGEIRTKVETGDIVIKNNILYGNGSNPALETDAVSLPGEDFNLVFNTADTLTFGPNTIIGDPLYTSTTPGAEDLHLLAGSPAIEAATDLGVNEDHDMGARPNPGGTDPDMGAYEFAGVMLVDIDVKPGSFPNAINYKSKGRIPVAILSSDLFDAPSEVSEGSLRFGPGETPPRRCSGEDVNHDGYDDLVCHFPTRDAGFECGDNEGVLSGELFDATAIEGLDSVKIVPCK